MKIILDLHGVAGKRAGKLNFAYCLAREILKIDQKNTYEIFTDQSLAGLIPLPRNCTEKVFPKRFHFCALRELKKSEADIYFTPTSFIVPSLFPEKIKTKLIIAVHDLVAFLFSQGHKKKSVILEKLLLPRALKKSSGTVVVSKNTEKDLLNLFPGLQKSRLAPQISGELSFPKSQQIKIIHNAASKDFFSRVSREKVDKIRKKYNLPEEFILSVGTLEPRKNIINLIRAFYLLPKKMQERFSLVLVGAKGWNYQEIFREARKGLESGKIIFMEYIDFEDLPAFYSQARVFAFPSFYEGFGIPILESFASETPVLTSNTSSMPEVAGKAAALVDPHDISEISRTLEILLSDKDYAGNLVKKGKKQVKKFSWERSARDLLSFFEEVNA